MMKKILKYKEFELNNETEKIPVPIVSDPAISHIDIAGARFIPLTILDTSSRPDIIDAIEAHSLTGTGDVESTWFYPKHSPIGLLIRLLQPSFCSFILEFDLPEKAALVDMLMINQALYLQAGKPGDSIKNTLGKERIIIEIPCVEVRPKWELLFQKTIVTNFRKKGIKKREAVKLAKKTISEIRKVNGFRRD